MRYRKKYAGILSLLLLFNSIGMTACGQTVAETEPVDVITSMENAPVIDYTVPVLTPNVLVDQQGYDLDGRKQAVVKSRQPVKDFRLVNRETGETVYESTIKQLEYNEELKRYIGLADFTDYTKEGEFYLECDQIGRSLDFPVKKDFYQELLTALCRNMHDRCQDHSVTEEEIITLLAVCEWYPQVLADDNGNEIPELLEDIAGWLDNTMEADAEKLENMCYVTALAKFGYLYQTYDTSYATQCIRQASTLYNRLEDTADRSAEKFMALTELYRTTGYSVYRKQILEYKEFFQEYSSSQEERAYLYGSMTYLSTRQPVDIELCTLFMERIRDRGEELAKRSRNRMDAVTDVNSGAGELLKQAEELSCANYVLYSYQYTELLKDILHYVMGRNRDSVRYYPEEGDMAEYLLLTAQQVSLTDK